MLTNAFTTRRAICEICGEISLSSLSDAVKRTSDMLKFGASRQVLDYEQRFSSLKNLYDDLLSNLIIMNFDCEEACKTAKEVFRSI